MLTWIQVKNGESMSWLSMAAIVFHHMKEHHLFDPILEYWGYSNIWPLKTLIVKDEKKEYRFLNQKDRFKIELDTYGLWLKQVTKLFGSSAVFSFVKWKAKLVHIWKTVMRIKFNNICNLFSISYNGISTV